VGEEPRLGVYSIEQAKARLEELLERAAAGEEVIITREGAQGGVRLLPFKQDVKLRRQPGTLRGRISLGPEFFEELPEEELRFWEGRSLTP
jgi:prevent-host-death family protein